jgi:hypothetical protein
MQTLTFGTKFTPDNQPPHTITEWIDLVKKRICMRNALKSSIQNNFAPNPKSKTCSCEGRDPKYHPLLTFQLSILPALVPHLLGYAACPAFFWRGK